MQYFVVKQFYFMVKFSIIELLDTANWYLLPYYFFNHKYTEL